MTPIRLRPRSPKMVLVAGAVLLTAVTSGVTMADAGTTIPLPLEVANYANGLCLDGTSQVVSLSPCAGVIGQRWREVAYSSDGDRQDFYLLNQSSGLCLDGSTLNPHLAVCDTSVGSQHWVHQYVTGNVVRLYNQSSQRFLDGSVNPPTQAPEQPGASPLMWSETLVVG